MLLATLCLLYFAKAPAQTAAPRLSVNEHPSFEVATVRPAEPGSQRQGFRTNGRQVLIENESVTSLVMYGYGVHPKQVVDGPEWMAERFDIRGTADLPGEPNRAQLREMLRKLLEERFGLKVHRAQREMLAYTVTAGKGETLLHPSKNDPNGPYDQDAKGNSQGLTLIFTNASMDDFAQLMQYFVDLPVVNRSGLRGKYDFTLGWRPDGAEPSATVELPDLFTAFQEQLGLKLSRGKEQVDALVIDHLERPSPN